MPLNFHLPLPGPFSYNRRMSGGGGGGGGAGPIGCLLIILIGVIVTIVQWIAHHWWVLALIPAAFLWTWLARRNDARLEARREQREEGRHRQ